MKAKIKVVIIIAVAALIAKPVIAQAGKRAFAKRIVITQREIRVDSLLKTFSKQTGIEFSFNSNKLSASRKVAVPKQSITLAQWLNTLKEKFGADHKVVGNHIVLVDNNQRNRPVSKSSDFKKGERKVTIKKTGVLNATAKVKEQQKPAKQTRTQVTEIKNESPPIDANTTSSTSVSIRNEKELPAAETVKAEIKTTEQPALVVTGTGAPVIKAPGKVRDRRSRAEKDGENKTNAIQFVGGRSLHGSGDMMGIVFGTEYINFISKRFSLNYSLRATINSSKDEYILTDPVAGTTTDNSVRFTTAGVQLGVSAGFSLLKNTRHDFKISFGPFGRYQSASNGSDGYSTYYPTRTGIQGILFEYQNKTPQETFAVGGLLQFQYDFTIGNKVYIGIVPGFQTDTNGDAIPQVALTIGRRL